MMLYLNKERILLHLLYRLFNPAGVIVLPQSEPPAKLETLYHAIYCASRIIVVD